MTKPSTYLEIEYPKQDFDHIRLLCKFLARKYFGNIRVGGLVDVGAGTGAFSRAFAELGYTVLALDKPLNLEVKPFPILSNSQDIVFSKSFLEHIWDTQHILSETRRVLKPSGIALFLVPDWAKQIECFWDDSTHIKPFTQRGLTQAFKLAGFEDIHCAQFCQLDFVLKHSWLKFLPVIIRYIVPNNFKWKKNGLQNIIIRHSKETMLLLTARK